MPFMPVKPRLISLTLFPLTDRWMPCHSRIERVSCQFSSASPTRRSFIHRSVSQSRTSREFAFGFGTALPLEQLNSGSGVAVGV